MPSGAIPESDDVDPDRCRHMVSLVHGEINMMALGTGHLCGEFTGPCEFLAQRPVTRSLDVFFGLRLDKRLSKQW